jgi:hypothetical protein
MWQVRGTEEVYTEFWWGELIKTDHLEGLDIDGRIILKWIFKRWDEEAGTVFLWLRIGTGGGLL